MGLKQWIRGALDASRDRSYEKKTAQKRGTYEEWILSREKAGQTVEERIREYFLEHGETLILYGDEDVQEMGGARECPCFRPDWSPERMESCFYIGSLLGFRQSFLEEALPDWEERFGTFVHRRLSIGGQESQEQNTSGEPSGKESSDGQGACESRIPGQKSCSGLSCGQEASGQQTSGQEEPGEADQVVVLLNEAPDPSYQETILSLLRSAGGWEKGCESIAHMHEILHHCSSEERLRAFAAPYSGNPYESLRAEGQADRDASMPLLSVIIPSKDHPGLLEKCLRALKNAAGTLPYEVIVVDNGSSQENRELIQRLEGISYLYRPMEFNFARMCNLGAAAAAGELLCFLNDDVELLPESDLGRMEALALRPGVGSVGLKLYYPDSKRIQHAGITNLSMGPVHKLQFLEDDREYYFGRNRGLWNVLAVSAACVMLRSRCLREAGGFEEELKVAFNDVALGFRLHELGYRNVCMCDAFAYHHESLTRGGDDSGEKLERLLGERETLYRLFPALEGRDPYYSPCLGSRGLDTRIRPAYETMHNICQRAVPEPVETAAYREDACLMGRIEEVGEDGITGYALVLGDDNACYAFSLLLEGDGGSLRIPLEGNYRPDLVENLPDQKNTGLCGFWVSLGGLPQGRYRLGFLADRAFGNIRLLSRSNRYVDLS